jgi:outer membrane PBP1 activator LpoA protein
LKKQQERAKVEAMRDKEMIDDIIAKINREDELEHEQRRKKIEETQAAVAGFHEERKRQMEAVERERREQEAEIEAYNEMMRLRAQKTMRRNASRPKRRGAGPRSWKRRIIKPSPKKSLIHCEQCFGRKNWRPNTRKKRKKPPGSVCKQKRT